MTNNKFILSKNTIQFSAIIFLICLTILVYRNYDTLTNALFNIVASNSYLAVTLMASALEGIPQFIPPDILILFSAILQMNAIYSLLAVIIGTTIGSYLAYTIGYWGGEKIVLKFISQKKYDNTANFLTKYGKYALPAISITHLPYFPLVFGAMKYNKRDFFIFGIMVRILKYSATSYIIYYFNNTGALNQFYSWFGY